MYFGYYSYLAAALAYGLLFLLLLSSWRSSMPGKVLALVSLTSGLWAVSAAQLVMNELAYQAYYAVTEVLRYTVWYVFLLKLFTFSDSSGSSYRAFVRWALPSSVSISVILLLYENLTQNFSGSWSFIGHIILSITGLAIIEQLYRNTSASNLWAIKYLFVGVGGIFAYDLFLYSHALLFQGLHLELWESRGIINIVLVPLIAMTAARNKTWSMNIFVSREIVLNTTAIVGGGIYLLVMALVGYYLREVGGSWGVITQVSFFSLSIVLLIVVMMSEQMRSRAKVFVAKHFYKNKYDYRVEWLRLTEELNQRNGMSDRYEKSILVLAQIVEARAGWLWLKDDKGVFQNVGVWQEEKIAKSLEQNASLIEFLETKGFIINISDISDRPNEYLGLTLPEWVDEIYGSWLIVPLFDHGDLIGFVLLSKPLVRRDINWEDRDLLKTASNQVTSFLVIHEKSEQLAESKQFEVFNRLSAYMVHDLKNVAAELELLGKNAVRFKDNPEFIEDAFDTVDNASTDIKRLLDQFRNRKMATERRTLVNIKELLENAVSMKNLAEPVPQLQIFGEGLYVAADEKRLTNVIAHMIDNAQEATPNKGSIVILAKKITGKNIIEISDTGCGMDKAFIENRLFKPFDTTKGNAGMGIGMFESRDFIRELGGSVDVSSEPGEGTKFVVALPEANAASLKY